ncbi:MAG TPA: hypothetical protein VFR78_21160 [Pyrinomonadaceae bacterium]|nr:hypothetical protein [Pyrinomonadaceae bacterium]
MKERELLAEKRVLEAEILERQEALRAVEILLNRIRKQSGAELAPTSFTASHPDNDHLNGHKRVRGVLKAAKAAAYALSGEFTRGQLFKKVEEMRPALAGKISAESQRSTMRTLVKDGWILETDNLSEITGEKIYRPLIVSVEETNGG